MLSVRLLLLIIETPQRSALLRRLRFLEASQKAVRAAEPLLIPWIRPLIPLVRVVLIIVLPVVTILLGLPSLLVAYLSLFGYTAITAPLINGVLGVILAANVAGLLAFERERGTYDLLSVMPIGRYGLHLTYCRFWLQTHPAFGWVMLIFLFIGGVSVVMGIGLLPVMAAQNAAQNAAPVVVLIQRLTLMLALYVDAGQSLVTAALSGMLAPLLTQRRVDAQIGAAVSVIAVQVVAYAIFYTLQTMFGVLLPSILPPGWGGLVVTVITVLMFLALREAVIAVLWRMLRTELGTATVELQP